MGGKTPDMAEPSPAARKLKELRNRAGLTVRRVAKEALGTDSHSTYSHYEDSFKKPTLPADLVRALIPIFTASGAVSAKELWDLTAVRGEAPQVPQSVKKPVTSPNSQLDIVTKEEAKEAMRTRAIKDAALDLLRHLPIEERLEVLNRAIAEPDEQAVPHPTHRARP